MAKQSKLSALRLEVFKKDMIELGYNPDAFSKTALQKMADETFKGYDGKQLRSFGSKFIRKNGQLVLTKVEGEVRKRQMEQIQSFHSDAEYPRTFGQQIADANIKEFYGFDIFSFIKANGIEEYDISQGTYYDPKTGELKSFGG